MKDPSAIAKALVNPTNDRLLVDIILSGIGAYPTFQWSIRRPFPLTDPTICEDGARSMYTALSNLASSQSYPINTTGTGHKPLLIVVSTARYGRRRGIPLTIYPQYHYLLGGPLADKKRMEEVVFTDKGKHVRDFVIMRPLFSTNGEVRGDDGLRVGWEWGIQGDKNRVLEPGPEIGYYVSRKDVGKWIFDKVAIEGGWEGRCVYLTY